MLDTQKDTMLTGYGLSTNTGFGPNSLVSFNLLFPENFSAYSSCPAPVLCPTHSQTLSFSMLHADMLEMGLGTRLLLITNIEKIT